MRRRLRYAIVVAAALAPLFGPTSYGAQRERTPRTAHSFELVETPTPPLGGLKLPNSALEPIDWDALSGWTVDDHAAAFATFLSSCRPLLRTVMPASDTRPMYSALKHVCHQALAAAPLTDERARVFFEHNFRPLRITKLGDRAGFLTGYYEPIVDGSRVPTGIFKVPVYRRPRDLVPPSNTAGPGFPNHGQSLRRTSSGQLVPYYDRGEILDGALDGQHLEICWIKDQMDALLIQLQGSARVRLEDGAVLRINYDSHNGYPFVPISRILIQHNVTPRQAISPERIREWIRANPQRVEEVQRQNRSFMFFRITGLDDDREPAGAQGVRLTPGRSIAVDNSLHVYGTPFFIQPSLSSTNEKRSVTLHRLMVAQDTGSAIVGPARADIYWGAGDEAGRVAAHLRHAGDLVMLVPRDLDPAAAAAQIPLPPERPPHVGKEATKIPAQKSSDLASLRTPAVATSGLPGARRSSTPAKLIAVRKSVSNISIAPLRPR
jgi:membrane-bound lytic murein transglycosylase A